MKKNQTIIVFIIIAIIIGIGAFYGGMQFGKSQINSAQQQRRQAFNGQAINQNGRPGNGNNFVNGEILAKDDKSVTLKLLDGGSKIIFFSDSTQITKSATGAVADLTTGENLMVNGTTNTDGSITAQTIQIRPKIQQENLPTPPELPKS
jgi:hypothetical protein